MAWLPSGCSLYPPRPPKDRASPHSAKGMPQLLVAGAQAPEGVLSTAPPTILSTQAGLQVAFTAPPCPSPTHLSRWSFWARVRQSAPRLQGGSRLVMIFCRMRKGILKALGPTRAGSPPSLSRASSSANLVSWKWGGVEVTVTTCPAQPTATSRWGNAWTTSGHGDSVGTVASRWARALLTGALRYSDLPTVTQPVSRGAF